MYFLEHYKFVSKPIKDAAGLSNSSCVMPFHTHEWKQIAICEGRKPLQDLIDSLPLMKRKDYRIISNYSDGRTE